MNSPLEKEKPRVLVVGGGPFQIDMILAARRAGAEVVVVDRASTAPGMALADHPNVVDTSDVASVVAVAKRLGVSGVVTAASDAAVAAVAAVAEACNLRGIRNDVALCCGDKLETFERMRSAGLAVPETRVVHGVAEARTAVRAMGGWPAVVKPRSAAGGRGVAIVRTEDQLADALDRAVAYARGSQGALVQQFVGGDSVGVEAFFWHGEIARGFVLNDQYRDRFVSPVGHSLPSTLSAELQREILADVAKFAAAAGIVDGPANFDLRRVNGRTVLIEINARLGGSAIGDLVNAHVGVDLCFAVVTAALGRDPREALAGRAPKPVAARLIAVPGRGRLRVLNGALDRARAAPGTLSVTLAAKVDEIVSLVVDEWSLLGSVLTTGPSVEDAQRIARSVADEIEAGVQLVPEAGS